MVVNRMTIDDMTSLVSDALCAVNGDYAHWPIDRQIAFRLSLSEADNQHDMDIVLAVFVRAIIGEDVSLAAYEEGGLSDLQQNTINWAMLLVQGRGADYVYLNEYLPDGVAFADFVNVWDYEHCVHAPGDALALNASTSIVAQGDLEGSYMHAWLRLLRDKHFHYASLSSLALYISAAVDRAMGAYIDALIPNELVEGPDHMRERDGYFMWDMPRHASGKERQLKAIKAELARYIRDLSARLHRTQITQPAQLLIIDDSKANEPSSIFIFNNTAAMKAVRWRHFYVDCLAIQSHDFDVKMEIANEIRKAQRFVDVLFRQNVKQNLETNH